VTCHEAVLEPRAPRHGHATGVLLALPTGQGQAGLSRSSILYFTAWSRQAHRDRKGNTSKCCDHWVHTREGSLSSKILRASVRHTEVRFEHSPVQRPSSVDLEGKAGNIPPAVVFGPAWTRHG
jgi:hypothetical protein